MTIQEFAELVSEMRHMQKEFFRTTKNPVACKRAEKKVDLACRRILDEKELRELFGNKPS